MYLGGLLASTGHLSGYQAILSALPGPGETLRQPIIEAAKPWFIAVLRRDSRRAMLVITPHAKRAAQIAEQLAVWLGKDAKVAHLPEPDAFFYEDIASDSRTREARLRALFLLADANPDDAPVVVTSARALLQRVVNPKALRAATAVLRPGEHVDVNALLSHLVSIGYRHQTVVEEPGSFTRRGGIVDIFPPIASAPVRLDFFDNELDSIRYFDPASQRSTGQADQAAIIPAVEAWPSALPTAREAIRTTDLAGLRPDVTERWQRLADCLDDADSRFLEYCSPYFANATVLDYLPNKAILVVDEAEQLRVTADELIGQADTLRAELIGRGELPRTFPTACLSRADIESAGSHFGRVELSALGDAWHNSIPEERDGGSAQHRGATEISRHWRAAPPYGGRVKAMLEDCARAQRAGTSVILISQQSSRLSELCRERDILAEPVTAVPVSPAKGSLTIVHGSLEEGFALTSGEGTPPTILVLTDQEIFGWSKPARVSRPRATPREAFISALAPGDHVVHVEHGVCRFVGLIKMTTDGVEREYLRLKYADEDHLYVPTDHADRVNRYIGAGDQSPSLSRLGGLDWARTKARVKAAAKEIAKELLGIYAARETKPGTSFGSDTVWQQELEASFPYQETADQLQAIAEVKADMERPKPMDRLICGDVGYGKTEIALRAAFKAVMDGKQVAILVPTTVLAQQHYNTFHERMQTFPIRLEVLSRFRSDKEQRQVIQALKLGTVDICIGTHRLIQKDVAFKDLGLVIIDEEQRFGVRHKEHLKRLRTEVDVLTLTATPIPRTLYMALAGVRDISTMDTPPEDRLPIKTYVSEYDERLIRDAIVRELERGGQIYFVHNRVQTIYQFAQRLATLVPEAKIAIGHGQLPEDQLEQVMADFAAAKYDVLLCSTIIESGLDIPNVNTIILHHAERLGLGQMYQLRGRVGRGANRAYAYFIFTNDQRLTPAAESRLRTIFEATELGAGFRIAMKDLEIRGAGNLLGAEQHGHVAAVGFDLYCRMLAEAVQELQGKVVPAAADVRIDLPLTAYLPPEYVTDDTLRLNLYQRLAAIRDEEQLSALVLELQDRFGPLPRPAVNLAYMMQIKLLASQRGVMEIGLDGADLTLRLIDHRSVDRGAVQRQFGPRIKLGHTVLRLERGRGEQWMDALTELLEAIGPALLPTHA